jgi:hypothetical protein
MFILISSSHVARVRFCRKLCLGRIRRAITHQSEHHLFQEEKILEALCFRTILVPWSNWHHAGLVSKRVKGNHTLKEATFRTLCDHSGHPYCQQGLVGT